MWSSIPRGFNECLLIESTLTKSGSISFEHLESARYLRSFHLDQSDVQPNYFSFAVEWIRICECRSGPLRIGVNAINRFKFE